MDDSHVDGRLARELVAEVLGAGGRGNDRATCLGAPEGDGCRRGSVICGRSALGGRRCCPDNRPGADEHDRHDENGQKGESRFHRFSFPDEIASTTRRGSSAARWATSAASAADAAANVKK